MPFLLAFDKFRGSMTAAQACQAAAKGLAEVGIEAIQCPLSDGGEGLIEAIQCPLSDGGEGLIEAIALACPGKIEAATVSGPLNNPTHAELYFAEPGTKAIVESAQACGLALLSPDQRNPELTTTFGVGQLIRIAANESPSEIVVGIGGSATNDGGAGMLAVLGWEFLDEGGSAFIPTGGTLSRIADIRPGPAFTVPLVIASDVTSPLLGPTGAARVFARQKGADNEMIERLDATLRHFADRMRSATGKDFSDAPGAGAAGGLGFALMHLGGAFRSGAEVVMELVGFDEKLAQCEVCITGEGSFDAQSGMGKLPMVVAQRCAEANVPCCLLAGRVQGPTAGLPFQQALSINPPGQSLQESLAKAEQNMRRTARELFQNKNEEGPLD